MVKLKLDNGKTVRLELVRLEVGDVIAVNVVAVNEKGSRVRDGTLCTFNTDGTMVKIPEVNDSLGFELNKNNKIKKWKCEW